MPDIKKITKKTALVLGQATLYAVGAVPAIVGNMFKEGLRNTDYEEAGDAIGDITEPISNFLFDKGKILGDIRRGLDEQNNNEISYSECENSNNKPEKDYYYDNSCNIKLSNFAENISLNSITDEEFEQLVIEAEEGFANSQFKLGILYSTSDDKLQNYEEAKKWLRMAAEQGLAEAQYELALLYSKGKSRDFNKKAYWLGKAAKQGHFKAIELLNRIENV